MIVIAGNSFYPGTRQYRNAVKLLADLNVDLNDVTIVDSSIKEFKNLVEAAKVQSSTFKIIAVGSNPIKTLSRENVPFFPITKATDSEKRKCRLWVKKT